MAQNVSSTTTDHETIRRWVEERGGWPAQVGQTAGDDRTGIIRIDFPGWSGEGKLERISWDEWFRKFDEAGLAFVYEEETSAGQRSNFNKLVARETAEARARGERTSRRKGARAPRARARTRSSTARRGATQVRRGAAGRKAAKAGKRAGRAKGRAAGARAGRGSAAQGRSRPRKASRALARTGRTVSRRSGASRGGGRARGGTRRPRRRGR